MYVYNLTPLYLYPCHYCDHEFTKTLIISNLLFLFLTKEKLSFCSLKEKLQDKAQKLENQLFPNLYRAIQTRQKCSNSNYFLPFDGVSVDGVLDLGKRAAEVAAKDRLKVVFLTDPFLLLSVLYDVGLTAGTKWKSYV